MKGFLAALAFASFAVLAAGEASPRSDLATDEDRILDAIFWIDIRTIDLTLTYNPGADTIDGDCRIVFRMRPGQRRPAFHFDPLCRGDIRNVTLRLDGESWLVSSMAERSILKIVEIPGTTQPALEIGREIADGADHFLQLVYRLPHPAPYPRFSTGVHDGRGAGNEEIFPTINSPEELARHVITFRVAGSLPYRCIGSGWVQRTGGPGFQEWVLDTEREVASYTVMFALLPEADTVLEERLIGALPVRIMAFKGGANIQTAFTTLASWLPELEAKLGPFPMPRGLSVFLTTEGGGIEYFGATITSVRALKHEVHHMYFGCSTVAKTYRDSWWDEAITAWHSDGESWAPITESFRSNIVSGRPPYAVGFDRRAYNEGAQMIEAMALKLGGRANMFAFLRDLHEKHSFAPFTSLDLAEYFRAYSGTDMRADFIRWLFDGKAPAWTATGGGAGTIASADFKEVDWTPPEPILLRYGQVRNPPGEGRR